MRYNKYNKGDKHHNKDITGGTKMKKIEFAKNITNGTEDSLVINEYSQLIHYDVAVNMMDDDLREELHFELAPCTEQEFFEAYAKAHQEKFGEVWELSKANPVY